MNTKELFPCPECKQPVTRRIDGCCPTCGTPIEKYKGHWFRTSVGSPSIALLKHFEELVSSQMSAVEGKRVIFHIPTKSGRYTRELVSAERLIKLADYDYDLTATTLSILFEHPRYRRKQKTTLLWLDDDFINAMALARVRLAEVNDAIKKETQVLQKVEAKEDIFA